MFYIMEYIDGRVFWDPSLPELDKPARTAVYDEMNRALAALHSVDVEAAGLGDYGKPGNYFERQVGRWTKQYLAAETDTIVAMNELIDWLPKHMPAEDGEASLVHGDYRLDNMIFAHDEPRILAIVDWELSTLGHPLADLAYQCMQWRLPSVGLFKGLVGVDRDALGIPSEQAYVDTYCARVNRGGIDNWTFYLAFSFFRLAAIVQGIRKRAMDGNASSKSAMAYGKMAQPLAEAAMALVNAEP
jgi:aminoglycoside phosphotransferase (APT) family kinase protein